MRTGTSDNAPGAHADRMNETARLTPIARQIDADLKRSRPDDLFTRGDQVSIPIPLDATLCEHP